MAKRLSAFWIVSGSTFLVPPWHGGIRLIGFVSARIATVPNPVVHFEIIGRDPSALHRFYKSLFGWDLEIGGKVSTAVSDDDNYGFLAPDKDAPPVAGGIGGGEGFAPHTLFYVHVEDVEQFLAKATALGGTRVLGPDLSPGGLTIGQFLDPEGNLVGLARPK